MERRPQHQNLAEGKADHVEPHEVDEQEADRSQLEHDPAALRLGAETVEPVVGSEPLREGGGGLVGGADAIAGGPGVRKDLERGGDRGDQSLPDVA